MHGTKKIWFAAKTKMFDKNAPDGIYFCFLSKVGTIRGRRFKTFSNTMALLFTKVSQKRQKGA